MGIGTAIHHVGTVLLLVATALLIVVNVTAPVVNSLALMRVDLGSTVAGSEVTFGTFGHCHRGLRDSDECSHSRIGYNPADIMSRIDGTDFGDTAESTTKGLTRVMVLHPIAAGLCFIAFLLCLGTGIIGSVLGAGFAMLCFLITIIAMACDFAGFSIIKHDVNDHGVSRARWGSGMWCMLAAAICTLLAAGIVLATCCAGRAMKRREKTRAKEASSYNNQEEPAAAAAAGRRRGWRFWQR